MNGPVKLIQKLTKMGGRDDDIHAFLIARPDQVPRFENAENDQQD